MGRTRPAARAHAAWLTAWVCCACCAACGGGGGGEDAVAGATAARAIQDGAADAADTNVVGVARMTSNGGGFDVCSGSLLAPNLVLTAHHCVASIEGEHGGFIDCALTSFQEAAAPGDFFVTTRRRFTNAVDDYRGVSEVITPRGSEGAGFCGLDIALLILDDVVPADEATPLVPRLSSSIASHATYDAVGYGRTGGDANDTGARRREDGLTVVCALDDCDDDGHRVDTDSEWVGEGDTCEGDSGGPALDGNGRVAGVLSRAADGCATSIYVDVAAWSSLVATSAVRAADAGGYDAPSWAGDARAGCGAAAGDAPAAAAVVLAGWALARRAGPTRRATRFADVRGDRARVVSSAR